MHLRCGTAARRGRLRELGLQPLHLRHERPIVELEQQLSLADEAAFLEGHVREQTRDARPDADGLHRFQASGELIPFGHVAGDGRRGGDLRQGRRAGRGLDPGAPGGQ
jgi:hypothetical protein